MRSQLSYCSIPLVEEALEKHLVAVASIDCLARDLNDGTIVEET